MSVIFLVVAGMQEKIGHLCLPFFSSMKMSTFHCFDNFGPGRSISFTESSFFDAQLVVFDAGLPLFFKQK